MIDIHLTYIDNQQASIIRTDNLTILLIHGQEFPRTLWNRRLSDIETGRLIQCPYCMFDDGVDDLKSV